VTAVEDLQTGSSVVPYGDESSEARRVRPGFCASQGLASSLQRVLVDVLDLHRQSKQAHWTVVGRDFRGIHRQLDDIAAVADAASDVVAERMRAIGVVPDGRTRVVAVSASLADYPPGERDVADVVRLVTERMREVASVIRDVEPAVSAEDVVTADMLHAVIADLEQQAWMLCSENVDRRTPLRVSESLP
jgi:starvation-inducible DNA-binding protein